MGIVFLNSDVWPIKSTPFEGLKVAIVIGPIVEEGQSRDKGPAPLAVSKHDLIKSISFDRAAIIPM